MAELAAKKEILVRQSIAKEDALKKFGERDAPRLKELKLIDSIIPEPLGGAHRNPEAMAASLKAQLLADLADLDVLSTEDLKNRRYQRLMSYGYA